MFCKCSYLTTHNHKEWAYVIGLTRYFRVAIDFSDFLRLYKFGESVKLDNSLLYLIDIQDVATPRIYLNV